MSCGDVAQRHWSGRGRYGLKLREEEREREKGKKGCTAGAWLLGLGVLEGSAEGGVYRSVDINQ